MRYDFRTAEKAQPYDVLVPPSDDPAAPALTSPFAVFKPEANTVHDYLGLHLWCRDGAGAGLMLKDPKPYGSWQVRCRISSGVQSPTTKICLLLWESQGDWQANHHEIDFAESGDRTLVNQTEHYGPLNSMHHTTYPVDCTVWQTFGVTVDETTISYTCNGKLRAAVANEAPGIAWNLHIRTEPHYDTVSETVLDVRWIDVPD